MKDKSTISTVTARNIRNIRIEIVNAIYEAKTYSSDLDAVNFLESLLSKIDEKY